jgi:hypothetical protein
MAAVLRVQWDGRDNTFDDVDIEIVEVLELLSDSAGYTPRRITAEVVFPWDVIAWVATGHHPDSATATVTLAGRLVMRAPIVELVPGRMGEPSQLTIAELPIRDLSQVPPEVEVTVRREHPEATAAVRDFLRAYKPQLPGTQYPDDSGVVVMAPTAEGRTVQIIFGQPGRNGEAAAPAWLYDESGSNELLMVAGHAVTTGTVTLFGPDASGDEAQGVYNVAHTTDRHGRTVAIIDLSIHRVSGTEIKKDSEAEYYVSWDGTASGLPSSAADVLDWLIGQTAGVRVDRGSLEAVKERLRDYQLDGAITERTYAWDLLLEVVLPILPVRLTSTARGVGFAWARLEPESPSQHIRTGEGCYVADRLRVTPHRGLSHVTVQYGGDQKRRNHRQGVTLKADEFGPAARTVARRGPREKTFKTHWVYLRSVAQMIAADTLLRHAVDRPQVLLQADPAVFGVEGSRELRLGAWVDLTAPEHGITQRRGVVSRIRRIGSDLQAVVTLV